MIKIFLDNTSTTPLDERVLNEMMPFLIEKFQNPSSIYLSGSEVRKYVENARKKIADFINSSPEEIIFTSGGTEANNFAIKGIAFKKGKGHIITSKIEHLSVLEPIKYLEKKGFEVTYLDVDNYGTIDPDDLRKAIRKDTILISIMYANNEVGTIQDIKEMAKIARENGIPFHTDAVIMA
ncbi:MAG: aminotransferase class V-fold PLP-dependent enzyme, partial [candidate division WOR-3 bacterium]